VNEETPDRAFVQRLKPFRRELLAHCYRMLGSVDEAEDVVQETYLRAWRGQATLVDPSAIRPWLYRIATNACLTAIGERKRRALPSGLGAPSSDPDAPVVPAPPDTEWIEPIPDALVSSESLDPAALAETRQHLRLAVVAALQLLPPRQRATFMLREVASFSAEEVAEMLDVTVPAVKSILQRARARLDEAAPAPDRTREPTETQARAVLDRYMAAFQSSDPAAIEALLCDDAVIEMTSSTTWFQGKRACAPFVIQHLGTPGEWRMTPTAANGQPAAIAYHRRSDGTYEPFGVAVLIARTDGLARITLFGADRVARFEPPPV
jgi:RNA polymerase sigma-70 factor (ECF subfamily)